MLIIRREGLPWAERAVRVIQHENGRSWWVNPATQVLRATGCGVNRLNCIQSFAQGLKDSGHRVMFDERREGRSPRFYECSGVEMVSCNYWLVGFAWGQGKWEDLIIALQRDVKQERWFEALESTAKFFLNNRRQKLCIILPPIL